MNCSKVLQTVATVLALAVLLPASSVQAQSSLSQIDFDGTRKSFSRKSVEPVVPEYQPRPQQLEQLEQAVDSIKEKQSNKAKQAAANAAYFGGGVGASNGRRSRVTSQPRTGPRSRVVVEYRSGARKGQQVVPQQQQPVGTAPTARAKLTEEPSLAEELSAQMLTPRLKGPYTDKRNRSSITTRKSWRKRAGKSCGEPIGKKQRIAKAKALRELLFRFSGSDDFADSHCQTACAQPGLSNTLTGVAVKSAHGGKFAFKQSGGVCRYQVTKPKNRRWQAMTPARINCECL